MNPVPAFWSPFAGREIDATPISDRASPARVVACLNVWNDREALARSAPTWLPYVDHVVAVDGSYDTIGAERSTDGTLELLRGLCPSLEVVDGAGRSQCAKRTAYLERGREGDYLFVVDADEHVVNGRALVDLPACDVGWVRVRNPIYAREYGQPRIFRWRPGLRYAGRHHWMYEYEQLFCTHQYGGPGYAHRPSEVAITNERDLGRSPARRAVKRDNLARQTQAEAPLAATPRSVMSDSKLGAREALWLLHYAYRDDGIAPSRLHTAVNRTTPHSSVLFKSRPGPFGVGTQYDVRADHAELIRRLGTADVLHIHTVVSLAQQARRPLPTVLHHHGSMLRANAAQYAQEAKRKHALVLVSNLELFTHTGDYPAFFLPNVVPVARYRALARENARAWEGGRAFRVCHSPTHAHRKGTKEFLAAVEDLQRLGYPIEPVLAENQTHADTLRIKSTCHAAFDSFWLGIQCSGLEAAAMGMPVIAGDPVVAERYREKFGVVPYTYANDREELTFQLRRLMDDQAFRMEETDRVSGYVTANHDESAAALTYLDYLDMAFHWRDAKRGNRALSQHAQLEAARR
jgi:hypothetical protein